MGNKKLLYGIMLAGIMLRGCETIYNEGVIGTGDVVSMEVLVSAFSGVSVTGECDVNIQIGEPHTLEVYAQQEILDVMRFKVSNGILEIGFKSGVSINTDEEIRAEITIPSVSFIGVTGTSDFKFTGAKQSSLEIRITGVGNVDAYQMNVDDCSIDISGVGDCKVWVNNSLDVDISGVGVIKYKGDPVVTSKISGTGSITKVFP